MNQTPATLYVVLGALVFFLAWAVLSFAGYV